jgi:hypothetical protein
VTKYAVIIEVDGPPTLAAYLGFNNLKQQMGIDMAEVACRPIIDGLKTVMLVDEDGRLKADSSYNAMASSVTAHAKWDNSIVGPAAIIGEDEEDLAGLSLDQAQKVISFLEGI